MRSDPRRPALALRRRMLSRKEMEMYPYCAWLHCDRPSMESLTLCLASDGTRLIRPFEVCSQHAEALPLPLFTHAPDPD